MVKGHSDSEKGNPPPPHRLLIPNMHHQTDRIAHTTVFVTPVVEHWLEREISSLDFLTNLAPVRGSWQMKKKASFCISAIFSQHSDKCTI